MVLKKLSILYAEDEEEIATEMRETLNFIFGDVFYAKNGVEALDFYKKHSPDLILSDIRMPQVDGLEFASLIRENDPHTPIVFLTSYSEQKYLLDAVNISSDGYVIKPVNLDKLIGVFSNIIVRGKLVLKTVSICGDVVYDATSKELSKNGELIALGNKEHALLKLFVTRQTLTKKEISYHLYPLDSVTDSAIKNLIMRLKNKLGESSISYVKGSGWKLNTES